MQQYYPRIAKILADHPHNSRGAVFAARSGCAPGMAEMLQSQLPDLLLQPCRKMLRDAVEYAKDPMIDTIVISAHWCWYLVDLGEGRQSEVDAALDELRQVIGGFINEGKRVYVILNIPRGAEFNPRDMIRRSLFPPAFRIQIHTAARSEIDAAIGPTGAKLRRIAQLTGAQVIDPVNFLCDRAVCPAITSTGEPMYKDNGHLRPSYVRDHVPFLDETVLDVSQPLVGRQDGASSASF